MITRADRCGPEVVELLRAAVVVGTAFALDDIVSLLDITAEEAARRAEIALRAKLLREAGVAYEFDNDLIREVLYESVPAPTRAVRHRRLAALFADQPERAAHHAYAAGELSLAADHWIAASHRAIGAFANTEADGLLTRALDALDQLGDVARSSRVRRLRAAARAAVGRYADAMEDLGVAETIASENGDNEAEAAAIAELGLTAYYARDMPLARQTAERAVVHPAAGLEARLLLARVRHADGDLAEAESALTSLTDATDDSIRSRATTYLASVLVHRGRFDDAVVMLDDAVNVTRRIGSLRPMLLALMFGAIARAELGDLGAALSWAEQLRSSAQRFDAPPYIPRALNILALVWRELDEPSKAHDLSTEALELAAPGGQAAEAEPVAHALIGLAESAVMRGDGADALDQLERIGGLASGIAFGWRIDLHRLEVMCRLEPTHAERLLDEARRMQSPKYEALAHMHLGRRDDAVAVAEATGSEFLVARVAPPAVARRRLDAVAERLPAELREGFARRLDKL